jgi:MFS family permease
MHNLQRIVGQILMAMSQFIEVRLNRLRRQLEQLRAKAALPSDTRALLLATLMFNIGVSVYFFLYNLFMLNFGYRERALGFFTGAQLFGSFVGTVPCGMVAQRFGVKKVLSVCLFATALTMVMRVIVVWYPVQLVFAFVDGMTLSGWAVCLFPAIADAVEERRRPTVFSVAFAIAVVAASFGGFIGGNMPKWFLHIGISQSAATANRRTLLVASGLTGLAAWPVTRLRRSSTHIEKLPGLRRPSGFLLRFLLASGLWAAAVGAFNPFTNVFFIRFVGLAAAHLGNFFAIAQLAQVAPVLLIPLLVRRTGLIRGGVITQLTTGAAVALLAAGHNTLAQEFLYCAFMGAQHMTDPIFQSLLMNRTSPGERSGAAALNILGITIAQVVAATTAGAAFQHFGYPPVLTAIAVVTAGTAILFGMLFRTIMPTNEMSSNVDDPVADSAQEPQQTPFSQRFEESVAPFIEC